MGLREVKGRATEQDRGPVPCIVVYFELELWLLLLPQIGRP